MAGSKRIQNFINAVLEIGNIEIKNLITVKSKNEDYKKDSGIFNNIQFQISVYNFKNPLTILTSYHKGLKFIANSKRNNGTNYIYFYDSPNLSNFIYILFSKIIGYKIIVDIVEDYSLVDFSKLSFIQRLNLKTSVFLVKKIKYYADVIIVISEYLNTKFKKITKNKTPIIHIPISINLNDFKNNSKSSNGKKIFYGGSFGEKDGVINILKAFELTCINHPDAELILTGMPPKAGMDEIFDYIKNSNVKEKIKYLGYLENNDYLKTLLSCDVFCATRINSSYANAGFPFKLGEMLATGKPVIASKVSDIELYLKDKYNALLVNPNSCTEIAESIKYVFDNPKIAKEIGIQGNLTALKFFDSKKTTLTLIKFLEDF